MKASARWSRSCPPANAEQIDVVAHDVGDIDRNGLVRECQANLAAAVEHARCIVHRARRTGTFDHIVGAEPPVSRRTASTGVFLLHVDHVIGAKLSTDLEPIVAGAGQNHRLRAERLRDRDTERSQSDPVP
jgi:hypothetical protein